MIVYLHERQGEDVRDIIARLTAENEQLRDEYAACCASVSQAIEKAIVGVTADGEEEPIKIGRNGLRFPAPASRPQSVAGERIDCGDIITLVGNKMYVYGSDAFKAAVARESGETLDGNDLPKPDVVVE